MFPLCWPRDQRTLGARAEGGTARVEMTCVCLGARVSACMGCAEVEPPMHAQFFGAQSHTLPLAPVERSRGWGNPQGHWGSWGRPVRQVWLTDKQSGRSP